MFREDRVELLLFSILSEPSYPIDIARTYVFRTELGTVTRIHPLAVVSGVYGLANVEVEDYVGDEESEEFDSDSEAEDHSLISSLTVKTLRTLKLKTE